MSYSPSNTLADELPHVADWRLATGIALVASVALFCYWPALHGDFLWDDDALITNNPLVKDSGGLVSIWFTGRAIDYWPVSNSSLWLEWRLWGAKPLGYHVTNLLLHIAGSLLVWAVLRRLSIPGAFVAALFFAVHPVNVEAVAWIAQRKTLLALVFFLLSILGYLKVEAARTPATERRLFASGAGLWYWLSILMFALAMLSKGSVATLPLILLLIVWYQRDRLTRWDLLRTAPFFAIAAPLVLLNIWFQTHGSGEVIRSATLLERLLGAAAAVWFYLYKAVLPINLMFVYPKWQPNAASPLWWLPLLAAIAASAALGWYRDSKSGRPLLFAWLYYWLALAPVLGFADVYFMKYSLVADHYQNLALIAVAALAGAAWSAWHQRAQGPANIAAGLVVATLSGLSFAEARTYTDLETLWRTTIARNPDCPMAHNNLGQLLLNRGDVAAATDEFQEVLRLDPDASEARGNLGMALSRAGRAQDGLMQLRLSVVQDPSRAKGHYDLGSALLFANQPGEAITELQEALHLKPDLTEAHHNLALALFLAGRPEEGIAEFRRVFELQPDFSGGRRNFGRALFQLGRSSEALEQFQKAVEQAPADLDSRGDLASLLLSLDRTPEALDQLREIAQRRADSIEAWSTVATVAAQANRPAEALAAGEKAMELARAQENADLVDQLAAWLDKLRAASLPEPEKPLPASSLPPQ